MKKLASLLLLVAVLTLASACTVLDGSSSGNRTSNNYGGHSGHSH